MKYPNLNIKPTIFKIAFVITLWTTTFAIQIFLNSKGITYTDNPLILSILFLSSSFVLLLSEKKAFEPIHKYLFNYLLGTVILIIISIVLWALAKEIFPILKQDSKVSLSNVEQISLDYNFIIPKIIDIFFQQLVVFTLFQLLLKMKVQKKILLLLVGLIFYLMHVPLLFFISPPFGIIYLALTLLIFPIFVLILLKMKHGFIFNVAIHTSFYILSPIIYRFLANSKIFLIN